MINLQISISDVVKILIKHLLK